VVVRHPVPNDCWHRRCEHLVSETVQRGAERSSDLVRPADRDLVLYTGGRKTIVQCKHWRTAQIGVSLVRELYGVMVAEKADRAIFVTTGTFTPDAVEIAHGKPLELVDGHALAKLVEGIQTSRSAQQATTTSPACPKCGGEMVQRVAKQGADAGKSFWGCRACGLQRWPGAPHPTAAPRRR